MFTHDSLPHRPTITQLLMRGSTECPVKAASPASRGRSEAKSLDGAEASRRIGGVMVGDGVRCAPQESGPLRAARHGDGWQRVPGRRGASSPPRAATLPA